ncbi:MAG: ABC transporter substrate-binding protein [Alphaproteobacteria bacterium]|nr:ABC transporter substrate-binding protein [Alphaproteobacteria bacterium]
MLKKINWKSVVVCGLTVLIIAFIAHYNLTNHTPDDKKVVRIAANFPLTGEVAIYGKSFQNGLLMSYEDNKNQIAGMVEFDWGDNQFSSMSTISVLQKQLFKNPTIYTSALKPQTDAVSSQISEVGIPHFVWIPDRKINQNQKHNNFRTWVNLQNEADYFVNYVMKLKADKVVIFHTTTAASHEIYKHYISEQLKQKNNDIQILLLEFPAGGVSDIRTLVQKAEQFKPEAIIINGFIQQMTSVVQLLKSYDVIENNRILASFDILDALDSIEHSVSNDLIVVAPQYMVHSTDKELEWAKRYRSLYKEEPNYHAAFAYDMGLVIWDSMKRLNLPATSEQWIKAIQETDIEGITGRITFDKKGDIQTKMYLSTIKDGKIVPVESEQE